MHYANANYLNINECALMFLVFFFILPIVISNPLHSGSQSLDILFDNVWDFLICSTVTVYQLSYGFRKNEFMFFLDIFRNQHHSIISLLCQKGALLLSISLYSNCGLYERKVHTKKTIDKKNYSQGYVLVCM